MEVSKSDQAQQLLAWFKENKRKFAWRDEPTPFHVAVAEALLQKTAAKNALPVYQKFLSRFPTVNALAESDLEEVVESLSTLGLPARARRLQLLAQILVQKYEGKFPSSERELRQLPGVGHYGAAAIASISFGQSVPMIDINVMRIFHRVFSIAFNPRNAPSRSLRELIMNLILLSIQQNSISR